MKVLGTFQGTLVLRIQLCLLESSIRNLKIVLQSSGQCMSRNPVTLQGEGRLEFAAQALLQHGASENPKGLSRASSQYLQTKLRAYRNNKGS